MYFAIKEIKWYSSYSSVDKCLPKLPWLHSQFVRKLEIQKEEFVLVNIGATHKNLIYMKGPTSNQNVTQNENQFWNSSHVFFIFQQFRIVTTPSKMDHLVFERGRGDFEKYYPASILVPKNILHTNSNCQKTTAMHIQ